MHGCRSTVDRGSNFRLSWSTVSERAANHRSVTDQTAGGEHKLAIYGITSDQSGPTSKHRSDLEAGRRCGGGMTGRPL